MNTSTRAPCRSEWKAEKTTYQGTLPITECGGHSDECEWTMEEQTCIISAEGGRKLPNFQGRVGVSRRLPDTASIIVLPPDPPAPDFPPAAATAWSLETAQSMELLPPGDSPGTSCRCLGPAGREPTSKSRSLASNPIPLPSFVVLAAKRHRLPVVNFQKAVARLQRLDLTCLPPPRLLCMYVSFPSSFSPTIHPIRALACTRPRKTPQIACQGSPSHHLHFCAAVGRARRCPGISPVSPSLPLSTPRPISALSLSLFGRLAIFRLPRQPLGLNFKRKNK